MALIFVPKIVAIVQHQQNLGSGMNNAFHETMSTKEEEERFIRLNSENDELKSKISEKERQIEEVKKKIEQLTKEQMERKRLEEKDKTQVKTILKKAVRIQEPDMENHHQILTNTNDINMDMTSDSGFQTSTATGKTSKLSENDFSESYL